MQQELAVLAEGLLELPARGDGTRVLAEQGGAATALGCRLATADSAAPGVLTALVGLRNVAVPMLPALEALEQQLLCCVRLQHAEASASLVPHDAKTTMQRHLEVISAELPALPGSGEQQAARFGRSCEAFHRRLAELRSAHDASAAAESLKLLRALASMGAAAAALGRRLAFGSGAAPQTLSAALSLLGLCHIAQDTQLTLAAMCAQQGAAAGGVPGGLSSGQLAGLLAWPAAVLCSAELVLGQAPAASCSILFKAIIAGTLPYLGSVAEHGGHSGPYAVALEEARTHMPAFLRVLVHGAGHLPKPGQPSFDAEEWMLLLDAIQVCVNNSSFAQAGAAVLAAAGPGGKLGAQLAAALLDFLAGLAQAGPPAACSAAAAGAAPGGRAAAAAEYEQLNVVDCWRILLVLSMSRFFWPYFSMAAARGNVGPGLVAELVGMLEQLEQQQRQQRQQRQQHAEGAGPAGQQADRQSMAAAASAQVTVAGAAAACIGSVLLGHGQVLDRLLTTVEARSAQAEQPQRLQGSMAQAAGRALSYALEALRALAPAASLLTATIGLAGPRSLESRLALGTFDTLLSTSGGMLEQVQRCSLFPREQSTAARLLVPLESALRCAPGLQSFLPPPAELLEGEAAVDLPAAAALASSRGLRYCRVWLEWTGAHVQPDEAERLLAATAALAGTACKVAVLRAEAAHGGLDAGRAPLGPPSTAGRLLEVLRGCEQLSQQAVTHAALASERCGR
ncbi:hypothetical protein ABPG75_008316 [Micractinium tetrahymenae]